MSKISLIFYKSAQQNFSFLLVLQVFIVLQYLNAILFIDYTNSCTDTDSLEDSKVLIFGLPRAHKFTTWQTYLFYIIFSLFKVGN